MIPNRLRYYGAALLVGASGVSFFIGLNFNKDYYRRIPSRTAFAATSVSSIIPSGGEIQHQQQKPSRASEIMQFGYPGFDNLRTFEDFVLSYDRRTRNAHWVYEHLSQSRMIYDPLVDRNKCKFRPDESIHPYFRATNDDYKASGYDRGHLAAAGNHRRSQNSVDQTFLLTNMCPQVGKGFNRDKWNDLEKRMRRFARKSSNVFICSGPLYLPRHETDGQLYVKYKVIGKNHVAVPTHFFKVALIESTTNPGRYHLESYVLPNEAIPDETPLKSFQVPVESIERAAGFLIFDQLPKSSLLTINEKKVGASGLW